MASAGNVLPTSSALIDKRMKSTNEQILSQNLFASQSFGNIVPQRSEGTLIMSEPQFIFSAPNFEVYLRLKCKETIDQEENAYSILDSTTLLMKCTTSDRSISNSKTSRSVEPVDKRFVFDRIFGPETLQADLFEHAVRHQIEDFLVGRSSTILTYGATNSGKTYTLYGTAEAPGVIPRSIELIFNAINCTLNPWYKVSGDDIVTALEDDDRFRETSVKENVLNSKIIDRNQCAEARRSLSNSEHTSAGSKVRDECYGEGMSAVWLSFAEIYNENIYDLLIANKRKRHIPLKLIANKNGAACAKDLTSVYVTTALEVCQILVAGQSRMNVHATALNPGSSRSHTLLTLKLLRYQRENAPHEVQVSTLTFCDLAGSVRFGKTQDPRKRLTEAKSINNSLHVLGRCLRAVHDAQTMKQNVRQIKGPFRDSKLTRIFQNALFWSDRITFMVNVDTSPEFFTETQSILNVSAVVKGILFAPMNNTTGSATRIRSPCSESKATGVSEKLVLSQENRSNETFQGLYDVEQTFPMWSPTDSVDKTASSNVKPSEQSCEVIPTKADNYELKQTSEQLKESIEFWKNIALTRECKMRDGLAYYYSQIIKRLKMHGEEKIMSITENVAFNQEQLSSESTSIESFSWNPVDHMLEEEYIIEETISVLSPPDSVDRIVFSNVKPFEQSCKAVIAKSNSYEVLEQTYENLKNQHEHYQKIALAAEYKVRELAYSQMAKDLKVAWKRHAQCMEDKGCNLLKRSEKQVDIFDKKRSEVLSREIGLNDEKDSADEDLETENTLIASKDVALRESAEQFREKNRALNIERSKCRLEVSLIKKELESFKDTINNDFCDKVFAKGDAKNRDVMDFFEKMTVFIACKIKHIEALEHDLREAKYEDIDFTGEQTKAECKFLPKQPISTKVFMKEGILDNDSVALFHDKSGASFSSFVDHLKALNRNENTKKGVTTERMSPLSTSEEQLFFGEQINDPGQLKTQVHVDIKKNKRYNIDESKEVSKRVSLNISDIECTSLFEGSENNFRPSNDSTKDDSGIAGSSNRSGWSTSVSDTSNIRTFEEQSTQTDCDKNILNVLELWEQLETEMKTVSTLKKLVVNGLDSGPILDSEEKGTQTACHRLPCIYQNKVDLAEASDQCIYFARQSETQRERANTSKRMEMTKDCKSTDYDAKVNVQDFEMQTLRENGDGTVATKSQVYQESNYDSIGKLKIREDRENYTKENYMEQCGDLQTQVAFMQAQLVKASRKCSIEHVPKIERLEQEVLQKSLRLSEVDGEMAETQHDLIRVYELQQKVDEFEVVLAQCRSEREEFRRLLHECDEDQSMLCDKMVQLFVKLQEKEKQIDFFRTEMKNVKQGNDVNTKNATVLSDQMVQAMQKIDCMKEELIRSQELRRAVEQTSREEIANLRSRWSTFEKNTTFLNFVRKADEDKQQELNRMKGLLVEKEREMAYFEINRNKTIMNYEALVRQLQDELAKSEGLDRNNFICCQELAKDSSDGGKISEVDGDIVIPESTSVSNSSLCRPLASQSSLCGDYAKCFKRNEVDGGACEDLESFQMMRNGTLYESTHKVEVAEPIVSSDTNLSTDDSSFDYALSGMPRWAQREETLEAKSEHESEVYDADNSTVDDQRSIMSGWMKIRKIVGPGSETDSETYCLSHRQTDS